MAERKRYRSIVADSARWDGFRFRDGDIVISTPAKCGTTWTQMLCALLIFDTSRFHRPLAEISPWLDMQLAPLEEVLGLLERQEHRRFIKTHTPLDGLPRDDRVTYVCVGRDPRDAALSWSHHLANTDVDRFLAARERAVGLDDLAEFGVAPPDPAASPEPDPPDELRQWLDAGPEDNVMSLAVLVEHLRTFWERRDDERVALFHYSDYTADLPGQMRRLADVLGIAVSDERIRELAAEATFEAMKSRAGDVAPNADIALWRDTSQFFRRGSSGQWREAFEPDHLRRYEERIAELAPPELVRWAHHGWLGEAPHSPADHGETSVISPA